MNQAKTGVLLINLGTPDDSSAKSVYRYLKQFLNDPRVIDLPTLIRYILVNLIIIPLRYRKSAHAYQQIWTDSGSPLLTNSQDLVTEISKQFDSSVQVELGMRYGNPSIESAVNKLKNCQKIIAIPLFPQYSSAATGSAIEELLRVLSKKWNIPDISIVKDFFDNPDFINAYANQIQESMKNKTVDKLIFSFHGLPERHITKSECQSPCSKLEPCPPLTPLNSFCYRAQCYETSRLLAQALHLNSSEYLVSFQSRLGKTPWIKPYTDLILEELRQKNIENIAIACPSFVGDCLETLEEINLQAREQWKEIGGHEFIFVPCINTHPLWVQGLTKLIKSRI